MRYTHDKPKQTSFRMNPEVHAKFRARAESENRSMSDVLDTLVKGYIGPDDLVTKRGGNPLPDFGQQIAAKGGQLTNDEKRIIERGG